MPEQKISYEERREVTAKRHADRYNAGGRREYAGGPLLRNDPEHMMDEAEETIAMQTESIRKFWDFVNPNPNAQLTAEMYLEEHGYIDPKADVITSEYAKQAESRCIPKNDKSTLQIIKDATEAAGNIEPKIEEDGE